jgi:hypothetical protein
MIRSKLTVFLGFFLFAVDVLPPSLLFFLPHLRGSRKMGSLASCLALEASLWLLGNYELVEILVSKNGLLVYLPVSICFVCIMKRGVTK